MLGAAGRHASKFSVWVEMLIDGMDIDEAWCDDELEEGRVKDYVRGRASRESKETGKGRVKYQGFVTTYIENEKQQAAARSWPGRNTSF